jgi:hypothetical protein
MLRETKAKSHTISQQTSRKNMISLKNFLFAALQRRYQPVQPLFQPFPLDRRRLVDGPITPLQFGQLNKKWESKKRKK